MDRRDFMLAGGGLAASAGMARAAGAAPAVRAPARGRVRPLRMKLGCQSSPATDEHFAYFARYGVRHIAARAKVADGRAYPTIDELAALKAMAERHGLSLDMLHPELLDSTHIDRERHPGIMLGREPDRQQEIDAFATTLRNCAAVGIPCVKYNMSLLGVLRTGDVPGRGDAHFFAWDEKAARPPKPLTRAGRVDPDQFWERITYFLDRIVPIANETKVRIACHPQDPATPSGGYQGIQNVLSSVEGLRRFVQINESPYHGLNFCQGTICENLERPAEQIFDVIRWFGTRGKIFNVNFRNIHGHRGHFNETFPDEGDIDMVRALRTYAEVGYDGMIMPDHVPGMDDPEMVDGKLVHTQRAENFAFAYGYIRGLMQSVERLV